VIFLKNGKVFIGLRVQKKGKLQEGSIEDIVWVLKVGEE